jgi:hypothetical protein
MPLVVLCFAQEVDRNDGLTGGLCGNNRCEKVCRSISWKKPVRGFLRKDQKMNRTMFKAALFMAPLLMGAMVAPSMAASIIIDGGIGLPSSVTAIVSGPNAGDFLYTYQVDLTDLQTLGVYAPGESGDGFYNTDPLDGLVGGTAAFSNGNFTVTDTGNNGSISAVYAGAPITAAANPFGMDLGNLTFVSSLAFPTVPTFANTSAIGYTSIDDGNGNGDGVAGGEAESFHYALPSSGGGTSTPLPAAFGPGVLVLGAAAFFGKRRMSKAAV